ncbi:carbohydrate porin, partial [Oscillatoriales cyanobacterium LEGE 11467]|nr:carbohydrate porin [Zarconia navalis LEGE 11467]
MAGVASIALASGAIAQTATSEPIADEPVSIDRVIEYDTIGTDRIPGATELETLDSMEQVTSVSQLSDVQPTDWAFQALQSLVERYGCIAGYPDGTYRGNQATTRYEFAAGLNACLDQILNLVDVESEVTTEDLAVIRRLQEEFAAELATLRGRVDGLEARTAELEANQFSTTTKLTGQVGFAISSVFGNEKPGGESLDSIPVFNNRVRLLFNTSFTGSDVLLTRLDALSVVPFGPGEGDEPNITGTSMTRTAFDEGSDNSVRLGKLLYSFALGDSGHSGDHDDHGHEDHGHGHGHGHGASGGPLTVYLDAVGGEFNENFVNFNEFFSEELTGSVSRFGRFNPIYYQGLEGTGASLNYDLGDAASLSMGYLAFNANNPEPKNGLFNGSYGALAQLAVFPTDDLRLGLT